MSMKCLAPMFAAAAFAVAPAIQAAPPQAQAQSAQQSQAKPDPKPEAGADAALAGKWNLTVESPNGAVDVALDLKVDGKKLAGTIASQMGEAKIEGELVDGKLTFWFSMDANGQSLNITFKGAQQKDGTLAGTLDFGQGEMNWKGVKAK